MKNDLGPTADKLMLRNHFLIETVRDILNPKWGVSIHATDRNAMVHVPSCFVAYAFRPSTPLSLTRQLIKALTVAAIDNVGTLT